jgi:hypothetical protein
MDLIPLTTIRPDTLHWLWPGWLPEGKLTILDGDPGYGQIAHHSRHLCPADPRPLHSPTRGLTPFPGPCPRLARGLTPFPLLCPQPQAFRKKQTSRCLRKRCPPAPSSVIILSAEDAIADTVLPRLLRFGADMSRIFTLGSEGLPALGDVSLAAHLGSLEHALAKSHARLVIIDPLMAFLDRSIATASDSSVRSVLTPVARLAQDHSCAILMVRHLSKKGRQT